MSSRLEEIRDRLRAIAGELRSETVSDSEAGALADEAAELTAEAVQEAAQAIGRLEPDG